MSDFNYAFLKLLDQEGYVTTDTAGDKGGLTRYGITQNTYVVFLRMAVAGSYPDKVSDLTLDQAKVVYQNLFWSTIGLNEIIDKRVAFTIFSACVNMGNGAGVKLAQAAVAVMPTGAMNSGLVGLINRKPPEEFIYNFAGQMLTRYFDIVGRDATQMKFLKGWCNRVLTITKTTLEEP